MKSLAAHSTRKLTAILFSCLLSTIPSLADERPVFKRPLQRQLESLILTEVRLSDTDFMDALLYLQKKAQTSPQGAMGVPFAIKLPEDFKPRYELTLDLKTVPFWDALGHLCGQAGVGFAIERDVVTIRPLGLRTAARTTVHTENPAPIPSAPTKGLSGPLGKPAQPFVTGSHIYRAMNGEIQLEKSGVGLHRNLNGLPIAVDPRGKTKTNGVQMPE